MEQGGLNCRRTGQSPKDRWAPGNSGKEPDCQAETGRDGLFGEKAIRHLPIFIRPETEPGWIRFRAAGLVNSGS